MEMEELLAMCVKDVNPANIQRKNEGMLKHYFNQIRLISLILHDLHYVIENTCIFSITDKVIPSLIVKTLRSMSPAERQWALQPLP